MRIRTGIQVTEAIGQIGWRGGWRPARQAYRGGLRRIEIDDKSDAWLEAKATIPRCVWESMPTEYGKVPRLVELWELLPELTCSDQFFQARLSPEAPEEWESGKSIGCGPRS